MLARWVVDPYRSAMTFWIVVGVLLVVLLAAMWRMDRNAKRRGARVNREIGEGIARGNATGAAADAHQHEMQRHAGNSLGI